MVCAVCDVCGSELSHVGPAGPSCSACRAARRVDGALAAHGRGLAPARHEWLGRLLRGFSELLLGQ
eukprot:1008032-Alexandrium_andersonii.AAC.1